MPSAQTDLRNYKAGLSSMWSEFGGDGIGSDPLPMTYDAPGNRLTMTATQPDYAAYSGNVTYAYDYKNELTSEASTRNGGSGLPVGNAFDYDGNFTELRGASVPSANADDQLTSSGYAYDGNGNPTDYNGAALAYDPENRLVGYRGGGNAMAAGYGYDGLRVWRQSGSTTVYFLYEGMDPVVQLSSAGVVNDVNDFGANGFIARHSKFYAPSGYLNRFYAFDPQGNTAEMIATNGTTTSLLQSSDYDAFGAEAVYPTTYTSDSTSGFGAQWGYFADNTEPLELLGHRYYDAASGRFVTRDPIGYAGGVDLYEYCGDRPVDHRDPYGYFSIGEGVGSCVAAAGLTAILFSGSGTCIGGEGCQEIGDCLSAIVGVAVGGTVAGGCGASVVASAGSFLSTCICSWLLPCAPKCDSCTAMGDAASAILGCLTGGISVGDEFGDTVVQTIVGGALGAGGGGLIGRMCDFGKDQPE